LWDCQVLGIQPFLVGVIVAGGVVTKVLVPVHPSARLGIAVAHTLDVHAGIQVLLDRTL
jgi:small basic protein